MKNIIFLLLFTPSLYSQEIVGGSLSPDLTKIQPYSLITLHLNLPQNTSLMDADWIIQTIKYDETLKNNSIITVPGLKINGSDYVFTGPPGNYMILCQTLINNKNSHTSINVVIPSSINPPAPPSPAPPSPAPPSPAPTVLGKIYVALVSDTSSTPNPLYSSPTIASSLLPLNAIWKRYDINSKVSNQQVPLSEIPWGQAALASLKASNQNGSITIINDNGETINSFPLVNQTENDIITTVKALR